MKRGQILHLALVIIMLLALPTLNAAAQPSTPLAFQPGDSIDVLRDKIAQNHYNFTVGHNWVTDLSPEQKAKLHGRHAPISVDPRSAMVFDMGPLAGQLGAVVLPSAFDWRNVNGRAYIGPVRDQGFCGSCYSFGAAAAAEGTYNAALDLSDASAADFSESFIAWCLGAYGPYSTNFSGCDGADYTYTELEALTNEGVTWENNFPYTDNDPGGCSHWDDPRVVFNSWHRIPCNDINAIKTALMTYGVLDVAVLTTSAFDAYSGGVYEDTNTSCVAEPCSWAETDHAVSLVGWDDAGDAENNGYWILRNSWGPDWGENGYMRIKYTSASVACAATYLVYSPTRGVAGALAPFLLQ